MHGSFPASGARQTTVRRPIQISGLGVHSAKPANVRILPAKAGHGIAFGRVDIAGSAPVPAVSENVVSTQLCTVIGDGSVSVATIEHLMAALHGLGVDNALVEVDGPELPIMDGASRAFVEAILEAGVVETAGPKQAIRVVRPVRVTSGDAYAEFLPHDGTRYYVTIDFADPIIGRQSLVHDLTPGSFVNEIADARTFGNVNDVMALRQAGYQLGSSLENSIAIQDGKVLNDGGLRHPDEFVRHKTLDAIGDLALAGLPFLGEFRSYKGGHRLNAMALNALLDDESAYEVVVQASRGPVAGAAATARFAAATALSPSK